LKLNIIHKKMELKDVVMISGKPGLYKIIGQRTNGLIVESLESNGKKMSTSPTQKISILADIAIFTQDGERRLNEVLLEIKSKTESGFLVPSKKDNESTLRSFIETIVPDYDNERVYLSDIKKLASWWYLLAEKLDFDKLKNMDEENNENNDKASVDVAKDVKTKKAAKSTTTPKASTRGKGIKTVTNRKQS
jgi:hypothetical protein